MDTNIMPDTTTPDAPEIFPRGAVVRFTTSQLGTLANVNDSRFAEHVVTEGDQGLYDGPHPGLRGWHVVSVAHEGRTLYVPVHPSQIESS